MPSLPRAMIGLVALGLLTIRACAESSEPEPAAELSADFAQSRSDLGTERAYIRFTNEGDTSIEVSGVGLSWPGYDYAELNEADSVLTPGRISTCRSGCTTSAATPTPALARRPW
ncbi:MAG: hypothetical protein ACRDVZ_17930 [Jiangellaceae bacterium]